ncbi:MAG: OmpA family protein, partial [Rhodobacteraceae bacterium]
MIRAAAFVLAITAGSAGALELTLPAGARLVADRGGVIDSYELPIDGAVDRVVPTRRIEGMVERQSWRVDRASLTTLQLLAPLRTQLDAAGYQTIHECEAATCGGFDFRFGIEVIPSPDMYVDIR